MTEINGKAVFGTPKSHHCRSVPLPRLLVEPMSEQVAGKAPDDLVFTAPGGVLRNNNFRRRHFDRVPGVISEPRPTEARRPATPRVAGRRAFR